MVGGRKWIHLGKIYKYENITKHVSLDMYVLLSLESLLMIRTIAWFGDPLNNKSFRMYILVEVGKNFTQVLEASLCYLVRYSFSLM